MLGTLIRLFLAVLVAVAAIPLAWDLLVLVADRCRQLPPAPWAVVVGLVGGAALAGWRRPDWLLHTMLHETCHALACLVLRVRIRSFQFSDGQGGAVVHDACDPVRGTLISIAPYVLPLVLGPAMLARLLVPAGPWQAALSALIGLLFITHLVGLVRNIRANFWSPEGDLSKVGRPLALVLIVLALLLLLTGTVHTLWRSTPLLGSAETPTNVPR